MQVILPDEQVHQIQVFIGDLIKKEIDNRLNNSNLESPYLNKVQTCKYLGISNNTLDSWIKKGFPVIKVGKTVQFDKAEINRWLQNKILSGDSLSQLEKTGSIQFKEFYHQVWWESYKAGQTTSTTKPPSQATIDGTEIVFRKHILPMLGNYFIDFLN